VASSLRPGEHAPDFQAKDQHGNTVSLSSFRGHPVVLYFYPKDNTLGCAAEACSFRDSMTGLRERGIVVLGVSVDSKESHARFASKYRLNFTLLSDRGKQIVRAYGVKGLSGTARRVTYFIGPDGIIKHVFSQVNTKTHGADVLKKLEQSELV